MSGRTNNIYLALAVVAVVIGWMLRWVYRRIS